MCNTLQHGGPDDAGTFNNEEAGLTLGHRRLSIIDLTRNGHQPMEDAARRALITFNGEIYNYPELKSELLSLGAQFESNTDTEIIIQAYLFWGTNSFARLRGMFAFALYDVAQQTTYLVRDTNGIKPLYYHATGGQLTFASEIRAFEAAAETTEGDEKRWPVWLLAFGNIPEPYTTLKNVFSLPKGTYLKWDKAGSHHITSFANADPSVAITNIQTAKEGVYAHLEKAVKRQLIADAPIGVFLSGGVDSTLVTLLADQYKKEQLKTISIFFDEKRYDERSYQDIVLKQLSGENFRHLVKQSDFETHLPTILDAMDMPTTDGINTWFISKYAHDDGLKAVLSGLGADELFGGYPSFQRIKYLRYLKQLPPSVFKQFNHLSLNSYNRLAYMAYNNTTADYLFFRGLYTPADIARILNISVSEVNDALFGPEILKHAGNYDKLHAAWLETNVYMQNQLLHDTDVMSMSHGLEVRVPFLDEDFKHFVEQIDPAIRFDNGRPKKMLIDSVKSIIPEAVWNRPKMGFTFPLQQWMASHTAIADEENYKGKYAKQIISEFKKGRSHWSKAFALYQIQKHA